MKAFVSHLQFVEQHSKSSLIDSSVNTVRDKTWLIISIWWLYLYPVIFAWRYFTTDLIYIASSFLACHSIHLSYHSSVHILRFVHRHQVSSATTSNYIPQILWDVITCPCPWHLLLTHRSSHEKTIFEHSTRWHTPSPPVSLKSLWYHLPYWTKNAFLCR